MPIVDLSPVNALPALPPAAPLADKTARARAVLAAVLARTSAQGVAVAFTGGKDSSVSLALWRAALLEQQHEAPQNAGSGASSQAGCEAAAETASPPLAALSVDTGLKFPQVTAFRDRLCADWNVGLTIARPLVDLAAYPVARDKVSCCRDLKILPLAKAIRETGTRVLLTGLRRDEHASRAKRPYAEWRAATHDTPAYWQVNPILDWTEMDVWAFITGEALPYCELYHEGYRSLGCMPCTRPADAGADERAGRDQEKERQLDVLKGLGYF
ncbi:phosphoadenosine phosphosulfate reductase family protein [Humidesulfovibrio idahonensis]